MANSSRRDAIIFSVETRFQQLARQPGGIAREAAIKNAQARLDEIKPDFEPWLDSQLQELTSVVQRGLAGDGEPNWVDRANAHCRQLRDVGTTMGYELVTFIADALCEIFDAIAAGAACNKESVVCHIDALTLARQEPYRSMKPNEVPELSRGLRRVVETVSIIPPGESK